VHRLPAKPAFMSGERAINFMRSVLTRSSSGLKPRPTKPKKHGSSPEPDTLQLTGGFETTRASSVIAAWSQTLQQAVSIRWNFRFVPQHDQAYATHVHFKNPCTPLAFFGFRVNGEPLDEVLRIVHMEENQYRQIWDFAEDLVNSVKAGGLPVAPANYLLAQSAWDDLASLLASSFFTVAAIPKPHGIRAQYKCAGVPPSCEGELSWVIDERREPRLHDFGLICVSDPAAVLLVLRSHTTSLESLALELAGQGVPFLMPRRLDHVQPAVDATDYRRQQVQLAQWRQGNYVFNTEDYLSYLCIFRTGIKEDERLARLAILSGGCTWRLALPFCDIEDILSGPSCYSATAIQDLRVRFQYQGHDFVEDRLLVEEEQLLIGQFRMPSNSAAYKKQASFMPPEKVWIASVRGHIGWTDACEDYLS
jgi:hypothetical protein